MKIGRYTVEGKSCCSEISNFLETGLKPEYKSNTSGGVLFFIEDYSLVNNSNLMIVVSVQKINNIEDHCVVEIVAGGGGEGLFAFTFGNEKRRVNKKTDLLYDFCEQKKYKISHDEIR